MERVLIEVRRARRGESSVMAAPLQGGAAIGKFRGSGGKNPHDFLNRSPSHVLGHFGHQRTLEFLVIVAAHLAQ